MTDLPSGYCTAAKAFDVELSKGDWNAEAAPIARSISTKHNIQLKLK